MSVVRTVKVTNVSLGATQQDIKEFFSFSGEIEYVEMKSDTERSQIAYVTFKDSQGAETAMLLSGATIVDMTVSIALEPGYQLPPSATLPTPTEQKAAGVADSTFRKAEDMVSGMLAKGFVLGKDALGKAKSFDEKHQLTSTATATVSSLDKKIGLTEKISMSTSLVNDKVKEVDQKLQVSEKAKSAYAAAEQTVSSAGSAIMKNRYVFSGVSWATGAFNKVAKAAGEVGQKTQEKVVEAEDEQRRNTNTADGYAQIPESKPPNASDSTEQQHSKPAVEQQHSKPSVEQQHSKPAPAQDAKP